MRHGLAIAGSLLAGLLLTAPAANAATRHATPTGTGVAPCALATPCSLTNAITAATAGDTVSLGAGIYDFTSAFTISAANVRVVGKPGSRPVLRYSPFVPIGAGLTFSGGGAKLAHVRVETPTGANGILGMSGLAVDDSEFSAVSGSSLTLNGPNSSVRNSSFEYSNPGFIGGVALAVGIGATNASLSDLELTGNGIGGIIPSTLLALTAPGAQAQRIVAENSGGSAATVSWMGGGVPPTLRHARLEATSSSIVSPGTALSVNGGGLVSDTVAKSSGQFATAVMVQGTLNAKLRNVTAIASSPPGPGNISTGLQVLSGPVSVKNSVFRGDTADVAIGPGSPEMRIPSGCTVDPFNPALCTILPAIPPGDPTITHSNFADVTGAVNAASANNQSGDPKFADAAAGDFHPVAGSPLIDAGISDPDNGTTDLDGRARKLGTAVDIGAYEVPAPGGPQTTKPPVVVPQPADKVAPALRGLRISKKRFAAGKRTVFSFSLSEPGTVAIAIQKASTGRRKGRSCVKATRKNRGAKKCKRYTRVGTLTRPAAAGANSVAFRGRLGGKALKPGKYRAVFVARDAAGNKARRRPTVGFTIVKR